MKFIDFLRNNPCLLDGRQFTELLMFLKTVQLLTESDMHKVQDAPNKYQVICLLDLLEDYNKNRIAQEVFNRFIDALNKARYTGVSRTLQEHFGGHYSNDLDDADNMIILQDQRRDDSCFQESETSNSDDISGTVHHSPKSKYLNVYDTLGTSDLESADHGKLLHQFAELGSVLVSSCNCTYISLIFPVSNSMPCADYYDHALTAFHFLEKFAVALLKYSWKAEVRKIDTKSGTYILRIAAYLQDSTKVLKDMGFSKHSAGLYVLQGNIKRDQVLEVAYQCFVAQAYCTYKRELCKKQKAVLRYETDSAIASTNSYNSNVPKKTVAERIEYNAKQFDSGCESDIRRRDSNFSQREGNVSEIEESSGHNDIFQVRMLANNRISLNEFTAYGQNDDRMNKYLHNVNTNQRIVAENNLRTRPVSLMDNVYLQPNGSRQSASVVENITRYMTGMPEEGFEQLLVPPQSYDAFKQRGRTTQKPVTVPDEHIMPNRGSLNYQPEMSVQKELYNNFRPQNESRSSDNFQESNRLSLKFRETKI